jgi:cytochrome P450 family 6
MVVLCLLQLNFAPKDVNEFFMNSVKETVEYREKNNVQRKDFMSLLLQLKNKGYLEDADSLKKGTANEGSKEVDGMKVTITTLFLERC